jgi:hypothetical protein
MIDPALLALAFVAFAGLIGWILAVWFFLLASKEMARHLKAEEHCTDLHHQLVAERSARIQQARRELGKGGV